MTITVRQEHIDAARNFAGEFVCWKCPVWQAAEEAGIKGIRNVTPHWIHFGCSRKAIDLPQEVSTWIFDFDTHEAVEPFSFEVDYV